MRSWQLGVPSQFLSSRSQYKSMLEGRMYHKLSWAQVCFLGYRKLLLSHGLL